MLRKQIYLTPEIDRELTTLARKEGRSTAEVIRQLLEEKLKIKKKKEPAGAVLLEMAENAFEGPGDLSNNLGSRQL